MSASGIIPQWATVLEFLVGVISGAIIIVGAVYAVWNARVRSKRKPRLSIHVDGSNQMTSLKDGIKTISRTAQFVIQNIGKSDAVDCRVDFDSWDAPFSRSYHLKLKDHAGNEEYVMTIGYLDYRKVDLFTVTATYSGDKMLTASLSYGGFSLGLPIVQGPAKGKKKRKVEAFTAESVENGPSASLAPDGLMGKLRVTGSEGDIHIVQDWMFLVSIFLGGIVIDGNEVTSHRGFHLVSTYPFAAWSQPESA